MSPQAIVRPELPPLPIDEWEATKDTLHLWLQIVGKVRLACSPPRNHRWPATLYVDVRGLTTRRMHSASGVTFQIDLDFVEHRLLVGTSTGAIESFALHDGLSVAAFDEELHATLRRLGIDLEISESLYGVPMTTPFPGDAEHAAYGAGAVEHFWRILDRSDSVFEEFEIQTLCRASDSALANRLRPNRLHWRVCTKSEMPLG
jgi:uncharacterized protein DUF5996